MEVYEMLSVLLGVVILPKTNASWRYLRRQLNNRNTVQSDSPRKVPPTQCY